MSALDLLTDIANDKIEAARQLTCRLEDCGATLELLTHPAQSQLSAVVYVRAGGKNKIGLRVRACFATAPMNKCHLTRFFRNELWIDGASFRVALGSVEPLIEFLTAVGVAIEDYREVKP